jgi:hypothetical protein
MEFKNPKGERFAIELCKTCLLLLLTDDDESSQVMGHPV